MAKGATKRSRRVVRTGQASLGKAAALDSKRFLGPKPLNADQVKFQPGRNNRPFTHSINRMAPIDRGRGLNDQGSVVGNGSTKKMMGLAGPLNTCS